VVATDAAAIITALILVTGISLLVSTADLHTSVLIGMSTGLATTHLPVAAALIAVWMLALFLSATREPSQMGAGTTEYSQVIKATALTFLIVSAAAFVAHWPVIPSMLVAVAALATALLLLGRYLMRRLLVKERAAGIHTSRTLVVGSHDAVKRTVNTLVSAPEAGLTVVAACVSAGTENGPVVGGLETNALAAVAIETASTEIPTGTGFTHSGRTFVPVVGTVSEAPARAEQYKVETVVIAGTDSVTPPLLKKLAWGLEPLAMNLLIAPDVNDIVGPRVSAMPLSQVPLLHVEAPGYAGAQPRLKRVFDLIGATILVAILAIPLILLTAIIKISRPGPIVAVDRRMGRGGIRFGMARFLSITGLTQDPEAMPLRRKLDAWIQRHSVESLPQLFNVIAGSMSLVGPHPARPPAPHSEEAGNRRYYVKPGMSGFNHVAGYEDLPPDEATRFDLYYVANWSVAQDLVLLCRSVLRVMKPQP
jgi:lipopolysaccharide/colanic/teichoic acid biosynthesis glycosyltransferase